MDTKKVQELLAKIEQAQSREQELRAAVQRAQTQLQAQQELTRELKRELAAELREVMAGPEEEDGRKREPGGERRKGVSAAILTLLTDGQPRSTAQIAQFLESQGLPSKHLSMALTYMVKKGMLRRVGRGQYAKS